MNPLSKGFLLAMLQIALLLGVAAKLLVDRVTLPKVWVRASPDSPIQGRYLHLILQLKATGIPASLDHRNRVSLVIKNGELIAVPADHTTGIWVQSSEPGTASLANIQEPVDFFVPEHRPNPLLRAPGEELWLEVTVPKSGPPQAIRLGVKKAGIITPLPLD